MRSHSASASILGTLLAAVIVAVFSSCSGAQDPSTTRGAAGSTPDIENTGEESDTITSTDATTYIDSLESASLDLLATKDEFLHTSAAAVFSQALLLLYGIKLSSPLTPSVTAIEPTCPSILEEGVKVSVIGGCIDENDVQWKGRATLLDLDQVLQTSTLPTKQNLGENTSSILASVVYSNFGRLEPRTCDSKSLDSGSFITGSVGFEKLDGDSTRFSINLIAKQIGFDSECQPAYTQAVVYAGSMSNKNPDGSSYRLGVPLAVSGMWSGSGRIGWSHLGNVEVSTTDERLHHSCANEPISGTTTLRSGADVAVITYDGATKCDDPGAATWTLNDEYQGEITGVSCSATAGSKCPWFNVLIVAGLIAMLRRLGLNTT